MAAQSAGQSIPKDTAVWLAGLGEPLRDKLAAVGLVEPARRLTVGEFLAGWLADRAAAGFKPTSLRAWGQTARDLEALFGDKALAELAHADGKLFRTDMQRCGLRPSTIHKRLGHAKAFWQDAVRLGRITANRWQHVRQRGGDPSERRAYISVAGVERVLEYCPNVWVAAFGGTARQQPAENPGKTRDSAASREILQNIYDNHGSVWESNPPATCLQAAHRF